MAQCKADNGNVTKSYFNALQVEPKQAIRFSQVTHVSDTVCPSGTAPGQDGHAAPPVAVGTPGPADEATSPQLSEEQVSG